jgi:hypothetical protein
MGFGLTPLFADRRGFMPPQLKTKTKQINMNSQHKLKLGEHILLISIVEQTNFKALITKNVPKFFWPLGGDQSPSLQLRLD